MNSKKHTTNWLSIILFCFTFTITVFSSENLRLELIKRDPQLTAQNATECQFYPVTIESWNQLGVPKFIQDFPGGEEMNLDVFTFENHITNFVCGLGENCLAGQQCSPFQGPLWLMLYNLQEWNLYINSFYEAISGAFSQIKEHAASMIADFLISPDLLERRARHLAVLLVAAVGVAVTGLSIGLLGPKLFPTWGAISEGDAALAETVPITTAQHSKRSLQKQETFPSNPLTYEAISSSQDTLSIYLQATVQAKSRTQSAEKIKFSPASRDPNPQLPVLQTLRSTLFYLRKKSVWSTLLDGVISGNEKPFRQIEQDAQLLPANHQLMKRSATKELPLDNFAVWNLVNEYLTSFSDHIRSVVVVASQIGMTAPVSSEEGVWGILRTGSFLIPNPHKNLVQAQVHEVLRLRALAQVLKSMNVFVTIGSDKCNKKGENGAWDPREHLSYCSPEGLMMNLIRAESDKSVNKIANAYLITEKYGYSVEFLAQSAWSCQEQNLKIAGRPSPNGMKTDSKAGCTFDLPVCDTRILEVAKLRKKHKSTVVACRRGLALNI